MTAEPTLDAPARPLVFVSYARRDLDIARKVVLAVQLLPVDVFWDQHLRGGEPVETVLQRAIDASACVVVLWSETSAASKWVQIEAAEADDRDIIVSALLDSARLPLRHRRRQHVDLRTWTGDAADDVALGLRHAIISTISQVPPPSPNQVTRHEIASVLRRGTGRRGLNLMGADLTALDLRTADLTGANLVGVQLDGADLRDATLDGANLERASLRGADITGASLQRSNLWCSDLTGVRGLLTADLLEANAFRTLGIPDRPPVLPGTRSLRDQLHSFPDYSSFLAHYAESGGLDSAGLLDAFPWLAHRYFIDLLGLEH